MFAGSEREYDAEPAEVRGLDLDATLLAQRHGTPVVPFGGGSGVVGGAVPPGGTIVVDTRQMNRLLELSERSLYARAEAGMMGPAYEAALEAKGYTTGHYPQSIALSTVGGWVATRAAGQFSKEPSGLPAQSAARNSAPLSAS